MRCLRYLEAQQHVVLFEVVLAGHLHFLELSECRLRSPVRGLQECNVAVLLHAFRGALYRGDSVFVTGLHLPLLDNLSLEAVLGVGEEDAG